MPKVRSLSLFCWIKVIASEIAQLVQETLASFDDCTPIKDPNELEREEIAEALRASGGNLAEAAEILGMSRTTLWRRRKELNL